MVPDRKDQSMGNKTKIVVVEEHNRTWQNENSMKLVNTLGAIGNSIPNRPVKIGLLILALNIVFRDERNYHA